MKVITFFKTTVGIAGLAVAFGTVPTAPHALQKYNMCDFDKVPADVIAKVTNRSDYEDILASMFQVCPIAALSLTEAATASTGSGDVSDHGRDGGGDNRGNDDDDGGKNDGGKNDGGKNDGGKNDGGKNDGGKNDGGKNDGGKNDGGKNDGGKT